MDLPDLQGRIAQLQKLAVGLAKEVRLWRGSDDVLLSRERKSYLDGIQDALAAVETARVTLQGVVRRIEGPVGGRPVG
jgi:hypothetical protein